jgi:hypothetical protein
MLLCCVEQQLVAHAQSVAQESWPAQHLLPAAANSTAQPVQ